MKEFSHNPEHGSEYHRLSTGRSFYAYHGVVGISEALEVYIGCDDKISRPDKLLDPSVVRDGGVLDLSPNGANVPLTKEETVEIAEVMIKRWEKFRFRVKRGE